MLLKYPVSGKNDGMGLCKISEGEKVKECRPWRHFLLIYDGGLEGLKEAGTFGFLINCRKETSNTIFQLSQQQNEIKKV